MNPYTPLHPNEQKCSQVFLKEVLLPCKILTELGSSRLETIICELGNSNGFFPFVWMKQADTRRTLINLTVFSRKPFRPNLFKCSAPFKTCYTYFHLFLTLSPWSQNLPCSKGTSLPSGFLIYQSCIPSRVLVTETWPWKCCCTAQIMQKHLPIPPSLLCFKGHFLPPSSWAGNIPHTIVRVTVILQDCSLLTADYLSTKHFLTWVTSLKGFSPVWVCNVSVEHLLRCYSPAWNPCFIRAHQLQHSNFLDILLCPRCNS